MTPDDFRKIVLACDGAVESSHMNHPDFRLGGKIFATLSGPDQELGMVKLKPDHQQTLVDSEPEIFYPATGAWGKQGCTMIRLKKAKKRSVKSAVTLAAENLEPVIGSGKKSVKQLSPTVPSARKSASKPKPSTSPENPDHLRRVRKVCLAFPDTQETITWGNPLFRVGEKKFAGLAAGILGCKLEIPHAKKIIKLPGFSKAPYVGNQGWVSIDLKLVTNWKLIAELIAESYGLIS